MQKGEENIIKHWENGDQLLCSSRKSSSMCHGVVDKVENVPNTVRFPRSLLDMLNGFFSLITLKCNRSERNQRK